MPAIPDAILARMALTLFGLPRQTVHVGRVLLLTLLVAQVGIGSYQLVVVFGEFFRLPPTLNRGLTPALLGTLGTLVALLVSAWLWAGSEAEAFAPTALAHFAALGMAHYATGLATGRLFPLVTVLFLAAALAGGVAAARKRKGRAVPSSRTPLTLTAWDALAALFLLTLLVPTVFPYAAYDVKVIWACRAFAFRDTPSWAALMACDVPRYPPLWSLLLWIGIREPIFEGRLLAFVLLPIFAVFLRQRLARISPTLAAPALLFFLSTVHVWHGAAMYLANVPLMIFLSAGSLLVLGLPARKDGRPPTACEMFAGTLCLCAATLIRPDGLYYLAVVAVVVLWTRWKRDGRRVWLPFSLAAVVGASWLLRSAALESTENYILNRSTEWRLVAPTALRAALRLAGVLLDGWQGQWFGHKGLGVALYLACGVALWRAIRGPKREPLPEDGRFCGRVSFVFVLAVAACYAAMPYLGDPRVGCTLRQGPYLGCYLTLIRVGFGRMTLHLFPFLVIWCTYALEVAFKPQGPVPNRTVPETLVPAR